MPTSDCRHPSGLRIRFDVERHQLKPCIAWLLRQDYPLISQVMAGAARPTASHSTPGMATP
jgi:hypothetical protein